MENFCIIHRENLPISTQRIVYTQHKTKSNCQRILFQKKTKVTKSFCLSVIFNSNE